MLPSILLRGLFALLVSLPSIASEFAPTPSRSPLVIYGAADYPEITPLVEAFSQKYPNIETTYTEFSTQDLYWQASHQTDQPDLLLSSAMDLQVRLVNDGYSQTYRSTETEQLPPWATWRSEVFGFAYEPATIVINTRFFASSELPKSRTELLEYIRRHENVAQGRLATFDIRKAGVGFLLWAHDSVKTGSYGRLLESFGAHDARIYDSSAAMLSALSSGSVMIGYNVLGSYAASWAKENPFLKVILPNDYTTVLMRTALIPKQAKQKENAARFLDFLLSEEGQQVLADQTSFYPIRQDMDSNIAAKALRVSANGLLRPIPLDVSLLVFSDQMKRQILLDEWERALLEYE